MNTLENLMKSGKKVTRNIALAIGIATMTAGYNSNVYANTSDDKADLVSIETVSKPQEREKLVQEAVARLKTNSKIAPEELVTSFSYDHDGAILSKINQTNFSIASRDPRFASRVLEDQLKTNIPLKKEVDEGRATKSALLAYFRTEEGKKKLEAFAPSYMGVQTELNPLAAQLQYPFDFATGEKSEILVFPKAFEKVIVKTRKGDYVVNPTIESLELIARHELDHAKKAMYGLKIGSKEINSSNYTNIDIGVSTFVMETEVLLADLEYVEKMPKSQSQYENKLLTLLKLKGAVHVGKSAEKRQLDVASKNLYDSQMDKIRTIADYVDRTLHEAGWESIKDNRYLTANR